jgi:membrane peptidoglycan carboxypeptidase
VRSIDLAIARRDDALDGTLRIDGVVIRYGGRLRPDGITIEWQLPPTEFARVIGALRDAVPEASFARIEGRLHARGTLTLPARRLAIINWNADAIEVGGLGTEALQYGSFRFGCGQRDGTSRLAISGDGGKAWIATDAMGPFLPAAVLAAEDQRFPQHPGYDPQAISEIVASIEDGRPKRGASTITQQLARTLFTGGEKTAVRKLRELLYALEMERTLGKARILELYLNTVDWGPALCGAKAAARAYFNKTPARLSAIEAAWLAGVLRNPHSAWEQQFTPRQPDRERARVVLMQMRDWPKRERQRFAQQPLSFAAPKAAREAPARALRAQAGFRQPLQATR